MSHDTLASIIDGLEFIYETLREDDERYARGEKAIQAFVDKRHDRLSQFYSLLEVLRLINIDSFGADIAQQVDMVRRADPELHGVIIIVGFRPGGNNYSRLTHNLYADSAN